MFSEVLNGVPPSEVLKKFLEDHSGVDNYSLADMFHKEFPALSGDARQIIWHWKSPKESRGLSDENMNALMIRLFKEAGYL